MKNKSGINPSQRLASTLKNKRLILITIGLILGFLGLVVIQDNTNQYADAPLYFEKDFEQALALAKAEDKLCFVKFYMDYCYPCDKVEEKIIRKQNIYTQLRDNYINFKVNGFDVETGGIGLAKKYNIKTFPTILITDWEGNEIERWSKGFSAEKVEKNLQKANALRTAPTLLKASDRNINPLNQPNPETGLLIEEDGVEKKNQEYGLVVNQNKSYTESLLSAKNQTKAWNRGIWVHPVSKRNFLTILGPFANKVEAKTTQTYLKTWEGKKVRIVRLSEKPVSYHFSY